VTDDLNRDHISSQSSGGRVDISTLFWDKSNIILIADDSRDLRFVHLRSSYRRLSLLLRLIADQITNPLFLADNTSPRSSLLTARSSLLRTANRRSKWLGPTRRISSSLILPWFVSFISRPDLRLSDSKSLLLVLCYSPNSTATVFLQLSVMTPTPTKRTFRSSSSPLVQEKRRGSTGCLLEVSVHLPSHRA
jgi:hypothetical protein